MSARVLAALLIASLVLVQGCRPLEESVYGLGLKAARALAGLEQRSVVVDGRRVTYLERPGGGGTTVLLHGFAANKDMWLRFAHHLPRGRRLLIPDLPGHGDNAYVAERRYDQARLARGVTRTLDALEVERFHLAGSSLGGLVATLMALQTPARVQTLALFDPAGVRAPTPSEAERLIERGDNPLIADSAADFERLLDFVYHQPPFLPWPLRPVLARMHIERADINRRIWHDLYRNFEPLEDRLDELAMPVLLVWGREDRVLDVSSVAVYERRVPDLQAVVLDECGHSPITEEARASARLYARFLSGAR